MNMALIFEKGGSVQIAHIIDYSKYVFMNNLTDFTDCPEEVLASLPEKLIDYCKKRATSYLRLDGERRWEITTD